MSDPDITIRFHRWQTYVVMHPNIRVTVETVGATAEEGKKDALHLIGKFGIKGDAYGPRRVPDYRDGRAEGPLDDHDWVQLDRAAAGSVSGIEDWPHLRAAIQRVLNFKALIQQHADKHGAVFGAHEVKLEHEADMRTLAHLLVAGLVTSGKDDVTITIEGVHSISPIGITPPKQLGDFVVTVERKNPPVGIAAIAGTPAPPSPPPTGGVLPLDRSAYYPPCPNCGSPSKATDPAHNSKREWTCTKEACGYMFSAERVRPPDHVAIIQPLYTSDEPIEGQIANIRTIYSYACLVATCRHMNKLQGPLAESATCGKCGASLHGDKVEHPGSIRSDAPATVQSPDTPPPAAPGASS